MRRRSGQKGAETAKPTRTVEFCKNRRVLSARTVEFCKTSRVLQEPSSPAKPVEFCKNRRVLQNPSSSARTVGSCKTRRVLQEPPSSAKPVEFCKPHRAGLDRFCRFVTLLAATAPHIQQWRNEAKCRWQE